MPEKKDSDVFKSQLKKHKLENKTDACNKASSEERSENTLFGLENKAEELLDTTKDQHEKSSNNSTCQHSKLHNELIEDEAQCSSSYCEGQSVGTSEDQNFHFHASTSLDESGSWSTVESSCEWTDNEDNGECELLNKTLIPDYVEEDIAKYCDSHHQTFSNDALKKGNSLTANCGKGISLPTSNNSQTVFLDENRKTTWNSNLIMTDMMNENRHTQPIPNYQADNEQESYYLNEDRNEPIKYSLRHENLDLDIVDTASCITLRLVSDKEHKDSLPPKRLYSGKLSTAFCKSEDDMVLLPPEESSSCFSDTKFFKISENNLIMSAESAEINQSSNSNTASGTKKNALETVDNSQLHSTNLASVDSGKASTSQPDVSEIKLGNDYKRMQERSITSDTDNTSHDPDDYAAMQSGAKETQQDYMAVINPEDKDFHFETENLKLNYKPNPESGSIEIKFRKRQGTTKLAFKSEEKKLYVKTTPLR